MLISLGALLSKGRTGPGSNVETTPKARLPNIIGVRPLTGRASTSLVVSTWPTVGLEDSSTGASAVIVMASLNCPTSIRMSTVGLAPELSVMP